MHLYSFNEQCLEFPHSYGGLGVLKNDISLTWKVHFDSNFSSIMSWSLYITLQKILWTYHDETIWRISNNLGQIPALIPQLLAVVIKPCALRSLILPSVSSIWLLNPHIPVHGSSVLVLVPPAAASISHNYFASFAVYRLMNSCAITL